MCGFLEVWKKHDTSQLNKAQVLDKLPDELDDDFSKNVLVKEAEAEGISSVFAKQWFEREKWAERVL